jgi:hypothetical protein
MASLKLPIASRRLEAYRTGGQSPFRAAAQGPFNRRAFAAVHVVADPLSERDPWLDPAIDGDAIEPLHPMYAADRACINTVAQANALCERLGKAVGIAPDVYHVWWDPQLERDIAGTPAARVSHLRLALPDHGPVERPRHDGRRASSTSAASVGRSRLPAIAASTRSRSSRPTIGGSAIPTRYYASARRATSRCADRGHP